MSRDVLTVTGVVEQMLYHAAHARWDALEDILDERFTILEPDSLPYGGSHPGVAGYVALMQRIDELFELVFEPEGIYALDNANVLLRMQVTFPARRTRRSVRLRVVELLEVCGGRVRRSEVFPADTAALLDTLR